MERVRDMVVVLGDQLDRKSAVFDGFDAGLDVVWMAEATEESTHVWSSKPRIAMFLTAMRHFRQSLEREGLRVVYHEIDDNHEDSSLTGLLERAVRSSRPTRLVMVEPGEWRVRQALCDLAGRLGVELVIRTDRHFLSSVAEFNDWAAGQKQLRLEYFYREMRRKTGVLMEGDGPIGDAWNFDKANRGSFGADGPGLIPEPASFKPDSITKQVFALVNSRFADHPGSLDAFDWPVTTAQARRALADFVAHRLPHFGEYQDAMWIGQPWLYHARLSAALNLHLLNPREVIDAAERAFREGHAPLNSVEGFVRQVLGWREYVRGVYWRYMPEYIDRNTLNASSELPEFYWTGQTKMRCLSESIGQTLTHGYAHHIQRLMVTGLFGLLAGVDPKQMHGWYLAVYVDAVEWVELPNVLGMSQYADDGVMASKPYAASGKYISRMSNYCRQCRFDPAKSVGEDACPFTTLYWDFLARHRQRLAGNGRMRTSLRNLERKDHAEVSAIRKRAQHVVSGLT